MKNLKGGFPLSLLALSGTLFALSACNDFFTTSVASALARRIDYSSLSLDDLLTLAATRGTTNSDAAKEILAALAGMSEKELTSLSAEQKSAILETAINATFGLNSILDVAESLTDENADSDEIINSLLGLAGSGIDMTAVKVILKDEDSSFLEEASVDTLVLVSAALVASVSVTDNDIEAISSAIESGSVESLDNDVSDDLKDTVETILIVVEALENREDEFDEFGSSLGIDLSEFIPGFSDRS